MNRPSFSAALDVATGSTVTLVALAFIVFGQSSGAAVLAWTAGELGLTGLTTGPPSQAFALAGFTVGFCALFAAYAALYYVLTQRAQPPIEPY